MFSKTGSLISELVRSLVITRKFTSMLAVTQYISTETGYSGDMIYRWRQGKLRPSNDVLLILARIGKEDAGMSREWGESLFISTGHLNAETIVNKIWGMKVLRRIPNNLPTPMHTTFIGRQEETKRLIELLSPQHSAHIISIDGIGGVGKTALVLETAFRCLRSSTGESVYPNVPCFDAIIFTSAKQDMLTPGGILRKEQLQRTLRDICTEIARTLDYPPKAHTDFSEQLANTRVALARQRTLLIVDNMETLVDKEGIYSYLFDLPPQVKVVITTREQQALHSPIRMEQLPERDGIKLIRHEAQEKGLEISDVDTEELYRITGGIPAAIIYVLGQRAIGHHQDIIKQRLLSHDGDVARFCFENSIAPLRGKPAHHLLMALSMFRKSPLRQSVFDTAGLSKLVAEDGLGTLTRLSLVSVNENRLKILPLTREYASAELETNVEFAKSARARWIEWYLNYTKQYGGYDWEECQIQFDHIEDEWENLLEVMTWCMNENEFEVIRQFWQEERISRFSIIYGYWDDRNIWSEWLLQSGERRGDWRAAVSAARIKSFSLLWLGQKPLLDEALQILHRAWELKNYASINEQILVADTLVLVYLKLDDLENANKWIEIEKTMIEQADLPNRERKRLLLSVLYYHPGGISYRKGEYEQAKQYFLNMKTEASEINWQRMVTHTKNWLADIAIHQNRLDEAEMYFNEGFPAAERNKDRRRIALFERTKAYLEQYKGNIEGMKEWGLKALRDFQRLGMQPEIIELQALLGLSDE